MGPSRDRLLVLLFAAALLAPWVDLSVRPDESRSPQQREHRRPAPEPELQLDAAALWKFPEAFESWFQDSLGLRDLLLRWNSLLSLRLFHVSPTGQVLLGRDGWYFYTGNHSIEIFRGLRPLGERELEAWKTGLEARRDWLRSLGAEYLFVIAPNKETVYPDYMPAELAKIGPTRFEQFVEYMRRNSDVDVLDLRPALTAARAGDAPRDHLYYEEGTHWNARGTLAAYYAIVERLSRYIPALVPVPDEDWTRVPYQTSGDTWAANMYIGDLSRQREVGLMRRFGSGHAKNLDAGREGFFGPGRRVARGTEDPGMPRGLIFHDSFGPFLENLLPQHFSRLEFVWSYDLDMSAVLEQRPQVVIDLWVERAFDYRDPQQLMPRPSEPARDEFLRSAEVCLRFDPARSPPEVEPAVELEVRATSDERGPALLLQTHSAADSLLLPPLATKPKGRPLVHVSIDSPADGQLDIFYLLSGESEYSRQHNGYAVLQKGPNDIYLRMPEAGVTGRLRLRPAHCAAGPYLLRAFELRSGFTP